MPETIIEEEKPAESVRLIKESESRVLTSDELLRLKSRSFYEPITLLETAKAPEEANKRAPIRCAYNILREGDTMEDGDLNIDEKGWALDKFGYITSQVARRNGDGIEDIIAGDLMAVTEVTLKGVRAHDDEERVFVEQFGKGTVLKEMHQFPRPIREAIKDCTTTMIIGMENFIEKGPIQTRQELKDYCFYVAGSVGEALNKIVFEMDKVKLDDEQAQHFGQYLQMTNIIKGIYRDWKEGRVYVPAEFHIGTSHDFLIQGRGPDSEKVRTQTLKQILELVGENFPRALEYVISIPNKLQGYKTFCFLPLIGARQTLETIKVASPYEVFTGVERAIKVSKGTFKNIGQLAMGVVSKKGIEGIQDWLKEYQSDPSKFSFEPGKYESWSNNWLA